MRLSIIMPVYNCRDYLEAAIASVMDGGVEDIEIIAVDDCSTDGSDDLLRRLAEADSRIRPTYNEKNMGVAAVRNLALTQAVGEYIGFCDSDDTVPKGAYTALLDASKGCDVTVGEFEDVTDSGRRSYCPLSKSAQGSKFYAMFSVCCLWTKIIKKDFISQHGLRFDEKVRIGEDVIFLAEALTFSPTVSLCPRSVYHHVHHDLGKSPSLTHLYTRDSYMQHLQCRKRLLDICRPAGIAECDEYVSGMFIQELDKYLGLISDPDDRQECFLLYRDFVTEYFPNTDPTRFHAVHGAPYRTFLDATADEYLQAINCTLPRERVEAEFNAGLIGFRWIVKYFKSWLKFKFKRS